ncbi:SGNH hydrolase-type esterase domain-containing protein [Cladochytrium replicatum]|nr:SGNH hydrolase-type esterase domain-containing protein [Cladochytrium replicatum]
MMGTSVIHDVAQDQIVLLGDSITQISFGNGGFGSVLADHYQRRLDVINRGLSGYNTKWVKPVVRSILATTLPGTGAATLRLVTVFLGANDSVFAGGEQYVSLPEFSDNLNEIITTIRSAVPEAKVILISPPPLHEARMGAIWEERGFPKDRSFDNALAYYRASRDEVGLPWEERDASVAFLDLFTTLLGAEDRDTGRVGKEHTEWAERVQAEKLGEDVLPDGLHLGPTAGKLLGEALIDLIAKKWNELAANNIQHLMPWHSDIDKDNLPDSLFVNARN